MIFDFNNFNRNNISESVFSGDIEDMIQIELDDEGIRYYTHKGYYSEKSLKRGIRGDIWGTLFKEPMEDTDRFCYLLLIDYEDPNYFNGTEAHSIDVKSGGIIDAIYNISKRTDVKVLFTRVYVCLFIFTDEEITPLDDPLKRLYNEIHSKFMSAKSDYANNTLVKFDEKEDVIVITTGYAGGYTDSKFHRITKELPISDFSIVQYEEDVKGRPDHITLISRNKN
jgi:hypothetical protein